MHDIVIDESHSKAVDGRRVSTRIDKEWRVKAFAKCRDGNNMAGFLNIQQVDLIVEEYAAFSGTAFGHKINRSIRRKKRIIEAYRLALRADGDFHANCTTLLHSRYSSVGIARPDDLDWAKVDRSFHVVKRW